MLFGRKRKFMTSNNSPDGMWTAVFEDDSETGYLYLCPLKADGSDIADIADHLWLYNRIKPPIQKCRQVVVAWSDDSKRTALIVDGECWGMFDLAGLRKLTAPRNDDGIIPIDPAYWYSGIPDTIGEVLAIRPEILVAQQEAQRVRDALFTEMVATIDKIVNKQFAVLMEQGTLKRISQEDIEEILRQYGGTPTNTSIENYRVSFQCMEMQASKLYQAHLDFWINHQRSDLTLICEIEVDSTGNMLSHIIDDIHVL